MMRAAWIVLKKELIDNLRDRRSLGMALLFPALSPLIVGFALVMGAKNEIKDASEPFKLAVEGQKNAPDLIAHLQAHGAAIEDAPAEPEEAVREHKLDAVLLVDKDFAKALREGDPARLTLIVDDARVESHKTQRRVKAMLAGYGSIYGSLRLAARGVPAAVLQPLAIEVRDVSTPESRAALFLLGLPLMLAVAAFIGGLYVAIDVTAGERERGSLEALAVNPVPRRAIGLGKIAAVFVFGAGSLFASGAGFALMPFVVPRDTIEIPIDPATVTWIVLLCLPLVLFATVLQVYVSTRAKGFKEAQSTLSYISLVPVLPGMLLTSTGGAASLEWAWLPLYGQQVIMGRWLRGESVGAVALLPTLATLAICALGLWLSLRRYDDERMYVA